MADDWNETIQEMEASRKARDLTRRDHEICCPSCYQRGLADAAKVCTQRADEIGEGSIGFTDVCVVIHRIRALADK